MMVDFGKGLLLLLWWGRLLVWGYCFGVGGVIMRVDGVNEEVSRVSTAVQVFERRTQVWEGYLKGESQYHMAQRLGVTEQTVWYDLQDLRKQWANKYKDLEQQKMEELAKLDNLERELWDAWERSKADREMVTTEYVPAQGSGSSGAASQGGAAGSVGMGAIREVVQKSGQTGDPRFLSEITKIIGIRCKVLGLEAPTKILSITIRWDLLTEEQMNRLAGGESYARVLEPSQYVIE